MGFFVCLLFRHLTCFLFQLFVAEIKGAQGRDLTIPCSAPSYLNSPSLEWSFSNGEDSPSHILTYDGQSGRSSSTPRWEGHVELDGFRVSFGDGSLRLMDPRHSEHTGSYICRFLAAFSTHTERSDVIIDNPVGEFVKRLPGKCAQKGHRSRSSKKRKGKPQKTKTTMKEKEKKCWY